MRMSLINRSLPRWIVLLADQAVMSWSFILSYFVLSRFEIREIFEHDSLVYLAAYSLCSLVIFYLMRIHTGLIRYSNSLDFIRIFSAVLATSLTFSIVAAIGLSRFFPQESVNMFLVVLISFFVASSMLVMLRMWIKTVYYYIKRVSDNNNERVLIYGSSNQSVVVKQALEDSDKFIIAGFIDQDSNKIDKEIQQKRVYHVKKLAKLKAKLKIDKLVVLSEDLNSESSKETVEKCVELGIKVVTVPPADQWISGSLHLNQIKDLRIEDLLQRPPIVLENGRISNDLKGKRVLVTGGAGSIGSEVVRQVLSYNPAMLIICDQAESPLYDLQLDIEENYPGTNVKIFIGNISNFNRMYALFKEYTPQIVYHAAAYKHVPMMEDNPTEAVQTNIQGTKNLADLSMTFDVERFVMISTDKAVNPTNVMGASKRIAEIYIQSLNNVDATSIGKGSYNEIFLPKTKFITTRFGNVLGSNGSVIPRFRSQIERGGPITVTHPDITRYFMTIPEAVQLVLEAGTMGNGGEIFIFDMGQPVKIVDLARKMIKLSGLTPDVDIKITFTGLRPGEKLYEELLNQEEETMATHHEKIKISKVRLYDYSQVVSDLNEIIAMNLNGDDLRMVKKMKVMVPEYKSKNSRYEELDMVE
ncbi:MAG: polysaccharide biosynthesis protein [Chitinophagaceae bacterium]|nr:MAG: polysaccharide biosynthesis protein [Chitinophagaceae bacterium]